MCAQYVTKDLIENTIKTHHQSTTRLSKTRYNNDDNENNNDSKSNNSNTNNNDNHKIFSNDNSDKSYDCNYLQLTQTFLIHAFYNHE